MNRSTKIIALIFLTSLSGCASSYMEWQPTIDTTRDPHASALNTDMIECKDLARQASGSMTMIGEGTGITTIMGAAEGALIGTIVGGPATGTAIGAVAGAGLGLGGSAGSAHVEFKKAYANCLKERGHPVVN